MISPGMMHVLVTPADQQRVSFLYVTPFYALLQLFSPICVQMHQIQPAEKAPPTNLVQGFEASIFHCLPG